MDNGIQPLIDFGVVAFSAYAIFRILNRMLDYWIMKDKGNTKQNDDVTNSMMGLLNGTVLGLRQAVDDLSKVVKEMRDVFGPEMHKTQSDIVEQVAATKKKVEEVDEKVDELLRLARAQAPTEELPAVEANEDGI